jgi:hypothetical protein
LDAREDAARLANRSCFPYALFPLRSCRPHSALHGRVPAEVYFGISDQQPLLNLAPPGTPDAPPIECPVEIAFLDPETERLPILVPKAA